MADAVIKAKIYDLLEEFVDDLAEHSNAPQEAGLACTIFPQLTALRVVGKSMRFYTQSYNPFFFNTLKPESPEFFTQSSLVCILGAAPENFEVKRLGALEPWSTAMKVWRFSPVAIAPQTSWLLLGIVQHLQSRCSEKIFDGHRKRSS